MDKEKMIEEMVQIMLETNCPEDGDLLCRLCKYGNKNFCNDYVHCENLINAGYGHIPTAIKEFITKIVNSDYVYFDCVDNDNTIPVWRVIEIEDILDIAKEEFGIDELVKEYE